MGNKTILHIAPTPFFADRGCHIRIEGIVRSLNNLAFENLVCTYHHGRDIAGVNSFRIKPIRAYTQTEAGPNKYKLWADWRLLWLCAKQVRRHKPAAIHAHLHEGLMIGLILKLLFFWRKMPLIGDIQGSLSGELDAHGSFKKRPLLRWPVIVLEKILVRCSQYLVCSSEHSLQQILEFGVSDEKVRLVQDGADPVLPLSANEKVTMRDELIIPNNKPLIVYSGALLDSKGLPELQSIIKGCAQDLHFLIIGYPTEQLEEFLQQHKLDEHCTLMGRVPFEDLHRYLQLADIAIEPKQSDSGEGSGKMLNYLASGLPVVAFDTENNRSFLPSTSGLVNSVDGFIGRLMQLATAGEDAELLGKENQQQFESRFSWARSQAQLAMVYRQLGLLES